MALFKGTSGDDNLGGTSGNDDYHLWQGGNDTVDAGAGNDIIRMGAALNAGDKLDGGAGKDFLLLNGDYSAGVVFNADTITNIEVMELTAGHSYNLTLNDGNVAAGQSLLVKAGSLGAGDSLTFDGSAETDGRYFVVGGAGDDTITGGAQGDHFHLEKGGVDTASGGGGNDAFYMGDQLWSDDKIDGGAGTDVVHVTGFAGGDGITFTSSTVQNVEDFVLDTTTSLGITTNDATVAAGATMTFDASAMSSGFFFDGSAETDGRFNIIAGSGDDDLTGGAGADTFHLEHGGVDGASGGDGNDTFYMGGTFNAQDHIDGGAGTDTVVLDGMGDDSIFFTSTTMTNVEKLVLDPGHFYTLITDDATVAAGQALTVDASKLGAGSVLEFNGSAETNGRFVILAGAGNDILTGGAGGDTFHLEKGGNDSVDGGGGNDHFFMGASLTAADQIEGGSGYDTVILNGGAAVTFSATTMTGVEQIDLLAGHSYSLTTNDATVAAGEFLTVDGSALGAGDALTFNGGAETDGAFQIVGGAGNDVITAGQAFNLIDLSLGGNDRATLGSGLNEVYMGDALTAADRIDGRLGTDIVILDGDYTGAHAVTFAPATMVNVDDLVVFGGNSYDLTSNDTNITAGHGMTVDGSALGVGDSLKFDGSAETNGAFELIDGAGNDVLKGGAGADFLSFDGGGTDTGIGGGGDDFIDACGHFDATDHFDGGTGTDTIELTADETASGNYTGADALHLTASMLSNIEIMQLDDGGSYDITTVDANVAAGSSLTVDGSAISATYSLTFDGSAETDGFFVVNDGAGNDTITGGNGNDQLNFDGGGSDTGIGGAGDDFIDACGHFDATDHFDGGTGTDTIELTASDAGPDGYAGANALVLTASMMSNIEVMQLDGGGNYDITTSDGNVAAGSSLTVDGSGLQFGDSLVFDGSAETDGTFTFIAGANIENHLTGGAGNDTFDLTGVDSLADTQAHGGGGDDIFQFLDNFDSSSQIIDGGTGNNTIALDGDYSSISLVGSGIIDNIQTVSFAGGHSYTGIQVFDDVAGGGTLTLDATGLQSGDAFGLDASLSTDPIHLLAGDGTYTVTGSAQDDTFDMGATFTAADAIDGGGGSDTVNFDGDYTGANALVFNATTMTNVEFLTLDDGNSYDLTTNDATVASGETLTVDASALTGTNALTFDGSAETDGSFVITGGAGDDLVKIGAAAVLGTLTFEGGAGTNTLEFGGGGNVLFGAGTITDVQTLKLDDGASYELGTNDGNVAAGATLNVDASALTGSNALTFDGTSESDGFFAVTGGDGDDTVILGSATVLAGTTFSGAAGSNTLELKGDFSGGATISDVNYHSIETVRFDAGHVYDVTISGDITDPGTLALDGSALLVGDNLTLDLTNATSAAYAITGGAGDDTVTFGNNFSVNDSFDGGGGNDTLKLNSSTGGAYAFTDTTITGVENLVIDTTFFLSITTTDANVAAGATLTVNCGDTDVTVGQGIVFDGSAEQDGHFAFTAPVYAQSGSFFTGGALSDSLDVSGSLSFNNFNGGGGDDTLYTGPAGSMASFNGGTGNDTVALIGGGTFASGQLSLISVENLTLDDHTWFVTSGDHWVNAGLTLNIDASALTAGHTVTFDGSGETNGNFVFEFGGNLTAADSLTGGGTSNDVLSLNGDYSGGITFNGSTISGIETVLLAGGNSYNLTTADGNVASGATLTVDGSGLTASDSLTFNGSAETDGSFAITGGAGDDHVSLGAEGIFGGSTFDGGAGNDTLELTAGDDLVFSASTMTNVETLKLDGGSSYGLTLNDGNVAAGATLTVDASALTGTNFLLFFGSAETDGNFTFDINSAQVLANSQITGGAGDDTLVLNGDFSGAVSFGSATIQSVETITLTAGHSYALDLSGNSVASGGSIAIDGSSLGAGDHFYFGFDTTGGGDASYVLTGGAGDDAFFMLDAFSASDKIDGGSGGNDEIQINGDYSAGVTFNADTIKNIGYFAVLNGNSYSLTENDGNVAAGATMAVTGAVLTASDYLHFYGAAETDGHFDLIGGAGDDILEGGNLGDTLTGNAGADTFLYTTAAQSSSTTYDTITDFTAGTDHFDLTTTITGVFAVSGSLDSGANFDSELAGLGVIQASGATVLTVTGGTLSGHTFLVVDGNGDDIYTPGHDYVFDITGYTGTITTGDFI